MKGSSPGERNSHLVWICTKAVSPVDSIRSTTMTITRALSSKPKQLLTAWADFWLNVVSAEGTEIDQGIVEHAGTREDIWTHANTIAGGGGSQDLRARISG